MLMVQVPETVEEPVTVNAKAVLVIDAPVRVSEPTETAAFKVTPAVLVTVSGTPRAVVGVQLIAPAPASANKTLPVPAPVLTDAAEVGAIETVPAADPLSAPVEMAPPAVIRLSVATALVTVPPKVMAPFQVEIEQVPATVNAPKVVSAKFVPIRLPPDAAHVTVLKEVNATVNDTAPATVSGAFHSATGVQLTVPAPPSVSDAVLVNEPVLTVAAALGLITTELEPKPPPFTAPVDTEPEVVVRVNVAPALNTTL